jgi:hypothetical protein
MKTFEVSPPRPWFMLVFRGVVCLDGDGRLRDVRRARGRPDYNEV